MSVPDSACAPQALAGFTAAPVAADIVELAALQDRTQVLKALASRRGLSLPSFGRVSTPRDTVLLCVRPERWLLLTAPGLPGAALASWRGACAGCAGAVEHSSALAALHIAGPAVREVLARGCRIDLHSDAFTPGYAAATYIAQVPVILAATPAGWLLLTPATTARHFHEWLGATARPYGFKLSAGVTVATLSGERPT